jgi:hypothetical protein
MAEDDGGKAPGCGVEGQITRRLLDFDPLRERHWLLPGEDIPPARILRSHGLQADRNPGGVRAECAGGRDGGCGVFQPRRGPPQYQTDSSGGAYLCR